MALRQLPPREMLLDRGQKLRRRIVTFFAGYFWLIFKNVIGWMLVLSALPVGIAFPGPLGLPMFLVGFALVTFPGKRRLTSRVMRGRGLPIEMQVFTFLTAFFAIVITCLLMALLSGYVFDVLQEVDLDPRKQQATYSAIGAGLVVTGLCALGATWLVMRLGLNVVNYVLTGMPAIRRRIRPWLRKYGVNLLPSRHRPGTGESQASMDEEILEISEKQQDRFRAFVAALLPWVKRAIGVTITIAIFYYILKPVYGNWETVRPRAETVSIPRFVLAAGMFSVFLLVFRVLAWRKIVSSFGCNIPIAPATRVWSTSEFARYLPGAIWQVTGRVFLARPYGISGSVCSITQILELAIFLMANILVAVTCLLYYGIKQLNGTAEYWLYVAMALVPFLMLLLHPRIFYGWIINPIMRRLKKPPIVQRLRGYELIGILIWNILGLLWQSLAIFIILQKPLGLKWDWWWIVAGAYCLAWCAGFLAVLSPGGLGVRELVFVGAMHLILPQSIQASESFKATLGFLSVLLRLWATLGELILAVTAYIMDFSGAMGRPDAPGRVPHPTQKLPDPLA